MEAKADFEKCHGNQICVLKLVAKLEKDITTIPREILNDVNDVVDTFKNIDSKLKKCGTDAIEQFETSGKKLVAKMTLCVDNKI